jgi:hypothetical protein
MNRIVVKPWVVDSRHPAPRIPVDAQTNGRKFHKRLNDDAQRCGPLFSLVLRNAHVDH